MLKDRVSCLSYRVPLARNSVISVHQVHLRYLKSDDIAFSFFVLNSLFILKLVESWLKADMSINAVNFTLLLQIVWIQYQASSGQQVKQKHIPTYCMGMMHPGNRWNLQAWLLNLSRRSHHVELLLMHGVGPNSTDFVHILRTWNCCGG